jgi:hypothetical protein
MTGPMNVISPSSGMINAAGLSVAMCEKAVVYRMLVPLVR